MMVSMFWVGAPLQEINKMKTDFHMHTEFSKDSESSPELMIKAAIRLGLDSICITDHHDEDFVEEGFLIEFENYFSTLQYLQEKYRDRIHIRIGMEYGLQPHLGESCQNLVKKYPFDFVIGSKHLLDGANPYYRSCFINMTDEEAYKRWFVELLDDVKAVKDFDVLGHLDYVVRYGTEQHHTYTYEKNAELIDEILKIIVSQNKGLEINTGGWKYGLPFAHPHTDVLKRYRELGGEIITIGSDAHKPEHVAYDFHKVSKILKACGFKYYTEFCQRKPIFRQLP